MLFGKYSFFSVLKDDAILPEYKGSTFRGLFGTALKRVVCALRKVDCKDCLLRDKCIYSFVFETPSPASEPKEKKRIVSPPHPYVIEPPETTKTHYRRGDSFDFALILFGKANEYLPYFIYAVEQMGKLGIGKRIDGKRGAFYLKSVTINNTPIYSREKNRIKTDHKLQELNLKDSSLSQNDSVSSLEITLKTPLRLKFQNKFEATLPFHVLTRAMLRRISSLSNYYGNGEPSLDYKGLVEQAKSVEIEESSLKWFDWKRYSNKQDRSILMGGIIGRVTYRGRLAPFMPLIRCCENVHIGKQTSFGLGRIEVSRVWQ
nr:CRISPR system precrRNA processing endoribonuclease RAMP protein Cas6 [Desulfobacterales bacterium]